jgi:hypothetical protein
MNLKEIVMGAAVLSVFVGLQIGVFTDHIEAFGGNFQSDDLNKLQKFDNVSSTADVGRQNAEDVQGRSNYFQLPGIVEIFSLPFKVLGVYSTTIPVIASVLHIPYAVVELAILFITLTAVFKFAKRNK